jgi:hypothetical protein
MQNIIGLDGVVDSTFHIAFILMDNKHLFNRKSLKPIRSSLRNISTSAESVLWNQLKSKNLEGRKFRRQQITGNKKSTTPAGKEELQTFQSQQSRPPLLQKEGKLICI